jgi:succinate dehydrogenase / fumarate reductase membrane anchor subunit
MNMRTPYKNTEGLGSAKSGTEHFWQQRMTAVANVPLVIFLMWFVISHLGAARSEIVASVQNPFIAILLVLSLVSILWHMRLGMQVVIEDYVHGPATKLACIVFNSSFTTALGVAALYAIFKMSFGV